MTRFSSAASVKLDRTPRLLRLSNAAPKRASISEIRLLTADGAMNARSPARAMVPASQTTMNRCNDR